MNIQNRFLTLRGLTRAAGAHRTSGLRLLASGVLIPAGIIDDTRQPLFTPASVEIVRQHVRHRPRVVA